jgi:hypothetical protein
MRRGGNAVMGVVMKTKHAKRLQIAPPDGASSNNPALKFAD